MAVGPQVAGHLAGVIPIDGIDHGVDRGVQLLGVRQGLVGAQRLEVRVALLGGDGDDVEVALSGQLDQPAAHAAGGTGDQQALTGLDWQLLDCEPCGQRRAGEGGGVIEA